MSRRNNIPRKKAASDNPAYASFDAKWTAVRFAMGVIRKIADYWDCSLTESFNRLNSIGEIEDDLIRFYDVLHTQGYGYIIPDIVRKWEEGGRVPERSCSAPQNSDITFSDYKQVVLYRKIEGMAIALISERDDILLSEAMCVYMSSDISSSIHEYCEQAAGEDEETELAFLYKLVNAQ